MEKKISVQGDFPMAYNKPAEKQRQRRLSGSSSSSSDNESSMSGTSSSFSSSSSSSSVSSDDEASKDVTDGVENKRGKVVAFGTVINDKIRVVPIKEKKIKPPKMEQAKAEKLSTKEKKDPTYMGPKTMKKRMPGFQTQASLISAIATKVQSDISSEPDPNQPSTSAAARAAAAAAVVPPVEPDLGELQGQDENAPDVPNVAYDLRVRNERRYMNDEFLAKLQHKLMENMQTTNLKKSKKSHKSRGSKKSKENTVAEESDDDDEAPPTFLRRSGRTKDWDDILYGNLDYANWMPPVSCFKHAPLNEKWDEIARHGMKVEIPNIMILEDAHWVATIVKFCGYKALARYESFDEEPSFAWISFCSAVPKPLGYCAKKNIILFPPYDVYKKYPNNFLDKLDEVLSKPGVFTIGENHLQIVQKAILAGQRYQIDQPVEAVNWTKSPDAVSLAHVTGQIGDRICIRFKSMKDVLKGFWFNCNSPWVHDVGWCNMVGLELRDAPISVSSARLPDPPRTLNIEIQSGMLFETIHPLLLNTLAAARISTVLNNGYFTAEVKCGMTSLQFHLHITSPWLLPVGFAAKHDFPLVFPPNPRESPSFPSWESYVRRPGTKIMPPLPPRPAHGFVKGAKLEAVDLKEPTFVGAATVTRIAEHILLLHFDGWKRDFELSYQFITAESTNIYPCGWTEMVGHMFQGRPDIPLPEDAPTSSEEDSEYDEQPEQLNSVNNARMEDSNSDDDELPEQLNSVNNARMEDSDSDDDEQPEQLNSVNNAQMEDSDSDEDEHLNNQIQ